jgi:hypothetical protein
MARGPQRRSKMTGKSTRLIEEIARITKTTDTVETAVPILGSEREDAFSSP